MTWLYRLVISPTQITSDQNDYAPTNWDDADTVRINSNAVRNITGFLATAAQQRKRIINVGTFNIILKNQSGSSSAANRLLASGGDITLQPNDSVDLEYDPISTVWRSV